MLKLFGINDKKIVSLKQIIAKIKQISVPEQRKILEKKINSESICYDLKVIYQKVKNQTATTRDLFKVLDAEGDSNGLIGKKEFAKLTSRLKMNFSAHRINEIFAYIKKQQIGQSNSELNEEEFEMALNYIQNKTGQMSLDALGISQEILIFGVIYLAVMLLLVFCFIFFGIKAFAIGGSFGSVINSFMAMAAGGGSSKGLTSDKSTQLNPQLIQKIVDQNKQINETSL